MSNAFALAGADSRYKHAEAAPAGFLAGVWHGLRLYDFGFLLGIGLLGPISVWIGPYRLF